MNMDIAAYQNMRISTRGKRPLRNLTPGDKVRAIQRIHNGETKASVSRDIGVPESTLRGWCKNEQKLRFMCRQLGAAVSNEQGLPVAGLENPPEKRTKIVDHSFDSFGGGHAAFGLNRLGVMSTAANRNNSNSRLDCKSNGNFISNNVISDFMKKSGLSYDAAKPTAANAVDSAFLQGLNTFPQLPLIPNAHLLSFLNPSLATQPLTNSSTVSASAASATAGNKSDASNAVKVPLRTSNTSLAGFKDTNTTRTKKQQIQPLTVKNFANESSSSSSLSSLCVPTFQSYRNGLNGNSNANSNLLDKNDTNNNAVRPALALSPPPSINAEMAEFPTLFPLGLPLPTVSALNVDSEARNNALLQWTKVFNASLNFLALAAAAAAVQPTLSEPEIPSSANSESSETAYRHDDYELGSTRPLVSLEQSEDSNFESEPEDLSVRSGTSKRSSPPQTPTRDTMSDSSTLSDNEH